MRTRNAIASILRDETVRQHVAMATVVGAAAGLVLLTLVMPAVEAAPAATGFSGALLLPLTLSM